MRSTIDDMSAGQTVLTDMVLGLARDMVQISRMDNRISKIEGR
jgi:hypothetical protein